MQQAIKVLSYNIHKGMNMGNRKWVLDNIRRLIRRAGADVVFLQEVAGDAGRKTDVSQFEYLADSVWQHYAYGKNAVYDAGHHGNAILSKFPFISWCNQDISTNRFEHRGVLHGVIANEANPEQECHLLCVHLNLLEAGRRKQLQRICRYVREQVPEGAGLILAGDMNDWLQNASRLLTGQLGLQEAFKVAKGRYARTFPAILPVLPLDRIYFRNCDLLHCERVSLVNEPQLSDHLPLLANFGYQE
ncbi:endonuclease/exonuclease/phosphatase family protein [Thalassomonas actiniarum]|uniref:Endonuclease/exonuclease/phosphatase family protein n=1 Tax=Thalassomonas actiniarum TaxID=485447 RepID=A0AAE9YNJ6_9GAMM|nr:endonuclease/exonuclease/phosphatase family protein [Thalassomonas actiniarum]WDD97603.1 endonuclease/exonuclease/phosphatase family protein [Thalassomonas actiniarum]